MIDLKLNNTSHLQTRIENSNNPSAGILHFPWRTIHVGSIVSLTGKHPGYFGPCILLQMILGNFSHHISCFIQGLVNSISIVVSHWLTTSSSYCVMMLRHSYSIQQNVSCIQNSLDDIVGHIFTKQKQCENFVCLIIQLSQLSHLAFEIGS